MSSGPTDTLEWALEPLDDGPVVSVTIDESEPVEDLYFEIIEVAPDFLPPASA